MSADRAHPLKKGMQGFYKDFYHINLKSVCNSCVTRAHSALTGEHKMSDTLGLPFN